MHGFFGKFVMTMLLTRWRILVNIREAALFDTISHVLKMRSWKQMTRPHAWRIVTVMADFHFEWNWTTMDFIRNTMCRNNLYMFAFSIIKKLPVSFDVSSSGPFPTAIIFGDAIVEFQESLL